MLRAPLLFCDTVAVHPEMRRTAFVEDLNRLACPAEQDRFRDDPERARLALDRLRYIDTSELDRYQRRAWLDRDEIALIERFLSLARGRLRAPPDGTDPIAWTRADPGWQAVRERAKELIEALDARIEIGVPGWMGRS